MVNPNFEDAKIELKTMSSNGDMMNVKLVV